MQGLIRTNDGFTVSNFMKCVLIIKSAFPNLRDDWFDILREVCVDENLTELELTECTKHFIKNAEYPTTASFLKWKNNQEPEFKIKL